MRELAMNLLIGLPLFLVFIQFTNKGFAYYLEPYPADIVKEFPPLLFPAEISSWNFSGLRQRNAIVRAAKLLSTTPFVSDNLEPVSAILVNHLESAAALENLNTTEKTKLGIQNAFSKHQIRHFKADVKVLRRRLEELLESNTTNENKQLSAIPTIQKCERIIEYFSDETYMFWEHKMIFFPYLMSFATLYAMAATSAGKLVPYKVPYLRKDMELLQATVLKYYTPVKATRMSNLTLTKTRVVKNKDVLTGKLEDMELYCPAMQILRHQPQSSPSKSCVRGHSGYSNFWRDTKALFSREKVQPDRVPEWFQDTVTGEIFCGWEGCWNSFLGFYRKQVENLTMSVLKLIPYVIPPNKLPQTEKKGADCHTDAYGRLEHMDVPFTESHKELYSLFGCHENHCWKTCSSSTWKYTAQDQSNQKVRCDTSEDCCPEWRCIY